MKKLPEQFKKDWVAALRSGTYKQGKNHLQDGDAYCCLGVAAVIAGYNFDPDTDNDLTLLYDAPPEVCEPLNQTMLGDDCSVEGHLICMNDNMGSSFEQIATWIEENL